MNAPRLPAAAWWVLILAFVVVLMLGVCGDFGPPITEGAGRS